MNPFVSIGFCDSIESCTRATVVISALSSFAEAIKLNNFVRSLP